MSTTTPSMPGGTRSEVSFTLSAFEPKIAFKSFSSGVRLELDIGVTLPTRMSPGFTFAPILIIPSKSRFFNVSSLTLGMSLVISSGPNFVSRASMSYSSM